MFDNRHHDGEEEFYKKHFFSLHKSWKMEAENGEFSRSAASVVVIECCLQGWPPNASPNQKIHHQFYKCNKNEAIKELPSIIVNNLQ